ncbi:solute carrier organic anion transporter family member 4C1-like isoform X5 [Hemicordylus capensis]|uniref:solute carrier organic anion transporter family member 4C1-like isoform X5 n=1 Tax=Hemicordylus capensis TaxID=884348 RepID=UPI002303EEC0|nr:solute carrier organic anion transporter family member 4C1-like isoform X5 [Hemicordylus capensis]
MKENGVDNPAFEPPSPTHGARQRPSAPGLERPSFDPDEQCCKFAPPALQVCNTPEGYLFFYSLLSVLQGIVVNGLVNVSISTIEKRFEMNSFLSGVISAGYDISFCVLCLFVSFFGARGHKPRWLALASFLIGLGSLVFSFPHFFSGKYIYGERFDDTCRTFHPRAHNMSCTAESSSTLSRFFYVFLLGQLIMGAGGTPLYTLGTVFIDDSVPKHTASIYIGISYAMSSLGPAIGYVLGGQMLRIYVDFKHPGSVDIDPDDPRWVGAWWISFVVCCFGTWLLVAPFSYFPKHLPGTRKIRADRISETHHQGSDTSTECKDLGMNIKDFPVALWRLLKNPVFMSLIIAASLESIQVTGFATFLPKYIEHQFGYSASYSATLAGCAASYIRLPQRNVKVYTNCSCIVNPKHQIKNITHGAKDERCKSKCKVLPVFIGFFFFAVFFTFMAGTPTTVAILRCVPERLRSFAMGVLMLFIRILGTIPGPIVFGVAIDETCTLWSVDTCGVRGSCWTYDNKRMAYMLVTISAVAKINTIIFTVVALVFYNPPPTQTAASQERDEMETAV